ncbi:MAG TPA: hypothetical protein VMW87_12915 [Spirochaetia bacterium]|nr:hypothetical protein [Spirochaetia bacterium]
MLRRQSLSENDCRYAMSHGEFGDDVISSRRYVAIILTQGWCPDWAWMKGWLDREAGREKGEHPDIDVYELEYNKTPYFDEFRGFKERTFKNFQIPYVRFYIDGQLSSDSNQLGADAFYARFREGQRSG